MKTVATMMSFAMTARTVRGGLVTLLGHLGRHINNWVTAAIARWERQAAAAALRQFGDRELKDIGLRRSGIDAALAEAARTRTRSKQDGAFEDATRQ
jgi:uncharacterized protein YjiS (DUF1127 family)